MSAAAVRFVVSEPTHIGNFLFLPFVEIIGVYCYLRCRCCCCVWLLAACVFACSSFLCSFSPPHNDQARIRYPTVTPIRVASLPEYTFAFRVRITCRYIYVPYLYNFRDTLDVPMLRIDPQRRRVAIPVAFHPSPLRARRRLEWSHISC